MPAVVRAGVTLYWQILPGNIFSMPQSYLPNGTAQELEQLLLPTLRMLNQSSIPHSKHGISSLRPPNNHFNLSVTDTKPVAFSSTNFPNFQDAFSTLNPETKITALNIGGDLIPRSLVASNSSAASLVGGFKSILTNGGIILGVSMDVSTQPTSPNAVHPGWRDSLFLAFLGTIPAIVAGQQVVTNLLDPALQNLTPNPAAYLNEAEFQHPN
ncbi:FAD-linked oxidoreductase [Lachnellula occidentalis]|uniref:FAD-linked oxidoreductase n=1 Tax=Lachnellula occidentalis TaxID=215460 RepID=A0A8H8U542_9HELO|nr:FAD-linked oxidoreductase [Lachnellula occidentalis]